MASVIGPAGTFLLQSFTGLLGALDNAMLGLGIFSLPVCITFAISKYHLYDIDRIISRTLAYAIVTGVLVGLYAAMVLLAHPLAVIPDPGGHGRILRWWRRRCSIHCATGCSFG